MTSVPETSCRCGDETLDDFLQYQTYEELVLGGWCTKCHHEWLKAEYLHNNDTVVGTRELSPTCILNKRYKRTAETFNFYYKLQRIETPASVASIINPGDHIWWESEVSGEHHAIVENVNRTKGTLTTIQCNQGRVVRVKVTKQTLGSLGMNSLHRADYNFEDPTDLTLTRARRWLRKGSIPDVLKETSNRFVVFCKTGSISVPGKFSSCKCGSNTLDEFRRYILDEAEGLLGIHCKTCGREWLKEEFLPNGECDDVFLDLFGTKLIQNKRQSEKAEKGRTPIMTARYAEDMLKVADHICWERICYNHHAIVENIDTENHTITVIHYHSEGKKKGSTIITRQTLQIEEECHNNLYRVDYKQGEEDQQMLTIARARSWIGEANYHLLDRNCEAFSVFCKTGILISWQIDEYYTGIIKSFMSEVAVQTVITAFAEAIERSSKSGDEIGALIVLILEVPFFAGDLWSLHYSDITREDFYYQAIVLAIQRLVNAGFVIGASILFQRFGGGLSSSDFGTQLGMFIGGIVGGTVGSIPGQIVGTLLGRIIGLLIWKTGKTFWHLLSWLFS